MTTREIIDLKLSGNKEVIIALSVIDDIDSKKSKANNKALSAAKLANKAKSEYADAAQLLAEAESLANKAIPQAKDLGAKALVKELQSLSKNLKSNIRRYNKNENALKNLT